MPIKITKETTRIQMVAFIVKKLRRLYKYQVRSICFEVIRLLTVNEQDRRNK